MITKHPFEKGLDGIPGIDTQYFGKDAICFLEDMNWHEEAEFIGKDCTLVGKGKNYNGIIIGFEDSVSWSDYYYIVYVPETKETCFELANNSEFVKSIIV